MYTNINKIKINMLIYYIYIIKYIIKYNII